jgi:hypothetical protein
MNSLPAPTRPAGTLINEQLGQNTLSVNFVDIFQIAKYLGKQLYFVRTQPLY